MTETVPSPRDIGVRLFSTPPASFNPLTAEPRELLAYGFRPGRIRVLSRS